MLNKLGQLQDDVRELLRRTGGIAATSNLVIPLLPVNSKEELEGLEHWLNEEDNRQALVLRIYLISAVHDEQPLLFDRRPSWLSLAENL